MHDHITSRVFLTAIGHTLDATAIGGVPFLVMRVVGNQRNRLTRKPAIQPIASFCQGPNLLKILLADTGFQGPSGYRFPGGTIFVLHRWNMQVNLFRAVQQKGKFVWPHPSHVSLLPKLAVLYDTIMIAPPPREAMADMNLRVPASPCSSRSMPRDLQLLSKIPHRMPLHGIDLH